MDLRKLKTLIDLVAESGVSELEISEGEEKVRIVNHRHLTPNHSGGFAPQQTNAMMSYDAQQFNAQQAHFAAMQSGGQVGSGSLNNNGSGATVAAEAAAPLGHVMKSPMVGSFYRSPNPESPEFIRLGDTVKAGQTLCIIEAMKLLNEIEADVDGVIKEIYIENGQGVEYDQPLFLIG